MLQSKESIKEMLKELTQELSDTQLLYLLGETLLLDVDETANIQYDDTEQPKHFVFKMENGRIFTVFVMEIKP